MSELTLIETCKHCGTFIREEGRGWIHADGLYTCRVFNGIGYEGALKFAEPRA